VYDPEAMDNVRAIYGSRLTYADGSLEAIDAADCLAIVTEWGDFRRPEVVAMAARMRAKVICDGRNLYAPHEMKARGFAYHAIGKAPV
jgi:UDPglucose 6-dehydrogenase